jgi:hypothetical protein
VLARAVGGGPRFDVVAVGGCSGVRVQNVSGGRVGPIGLRSCCEGHFHKSKEFFRKVFLSRMLSTRHWRKECWTFVRGASMEDFDCVRC